MSTGEIAKALAAFQAEMPTVAKSNTANVPTKAGGSYSYTYADLADVSAAATPLLAKNGLSFACLPRRCDDGSYELAGTLLHTSGESLEGSLPVFGRTAQEIGSALTYGRRYLLGCMTGIVTDADDDGAASQGAAPTQHHPSEQGSTHLASEKQVNLVGMLMEKVGITQPERAKAFVRDLIGRDIATRKELTSREASKVIDKLKELESQPFPDGAPASAPDPWEQP